jgi:hypothetical protein
MFEIGNSLREARHRRQIELPQVEEATKIRVKYLRALEDEQFDILPSDIYVKGFLRAYADYLGLDGQLYVDEYNSRFVVGEEHELRSRRTVSRRPERSRRLETGIVLFALAIVAVVTIVVISAWSSSSKQPTTPRAAHRTVTSHKRTTPPPTIAVRAITGTSWVAIRSGGPGGKVAFQGTIARGQPVTLTGKRFWLDISTPENLLIEIRGKPISVVGGKPLVLTVTPTGWESP